MNPYRVTEDFEQALCEYTGAPYAVALNSCTAAIQLCAEWFGPRSVTIPKRTYVSVPNALKLAGYGVTFRDEKWRGSYRIIPTPIWDCARRFTSGMYKPKTFQCLSFATTKILGIEQGGAILHDNRKADRWFRAMRFDGRTEGTMPRNETVTVIGHHCLMLPSIAAQLILKLYHLPKVNADLPDYDYPDLSTFKVFK